MFQLLFVVLPRLFSVHGANPSTDQTINVYSVGIVGASNNTPMAITIIHRIRFSRRDNTTAPSQRSHAKAITIHSLPGITSRSNLKTRTHIPHTRSACSKQAILGHGKLNTQFFIWMSLKIKLCFLAKEICVCFVFGPWRLRPSLRRLAFQRI